MRSGKASLMERVAAFIVDKRNIIFLIYIAAAVFCIFSSGWVEVSDSLTKYLPESTETQIGLELMDDEFTTFGTARIVVENVSYEQAEKICADIERVPGVKEVAFDDSPEHYNEAAALFSVTFDGENDDEVSVLAMDTLRDMLSVDDLYETLDLPEDEDIDSNTVNGLVQEKTCHLPKVGDHFTLGDYEGVVTRTARRRVTEVRFTHTAPAPQDDEKDKDKRFSRLAQRTEGR